MRRLRHLTGQHRTASINRQFGGVLAFTTGAAMTVVLVNWARSEYALSFLLEAMPMLMLLLALSLPLLFADFHRTLRRKVKAIQPSAVLHAIWNIKPRLLRHGGVANPRDTCGYRCGLRLALTQNPSLLWVPASMQHCTRNSS